MNGSPSQCTISNPFLQISYWILPFPTKRKCHRPCMQGDSGPPKVNGTNVHLVIFFKINTECPGRDISSIPPSTSGFCPQPCCHRSSAIFQILGIVSFSHPPKSICSIVPAPPIVVTMPKDLYLNGGDSFSL